MDRTYKFRIVVTDAVNRKSISKAFSCELSKEEILQKCLDALKIENKKEEAPIENSGNTTPPSGSSV